MATTSDLRASLTCLTDMGVIFPGYDSGPMLPLRPDNGVVFPYMPVVMATHTANYAEHHPTHSNFMYRFFKNYGVQNFTCTATFTSGTLAEARYAMGAHHFFKSAMRMGFGESDPYRGVPPPVLSFNALGHGWFQNVPVVITNYTYNLDSNQDYVNFNDVHLKEILAPIKFEAILDLLPQYNTRQTRTEHTLEDFVNGRLLEKGYI